MHNLQIHEQGSTIQERPSSVRAATALLQIKQGYKSYKPPSRGTYKIRRQNLFPMSRSTRENKKLLPTSYLQGQNFNVSLTKRCARLSRN